ncbi:hypothetical protein BBK36DRAFT_1172035 [Trichoderma citrinoviride]|uniref:MFS general substrate transporter n=1 Tax=Trichoderma citrinoviride TaxID=58853 RepID=A0A2T4B1N8_9HYPO|nr:hypothetical protein BBK36DRAFT_1172035 [Trichoderma citrinoviride]PTB63237.1 hypothetical protein BBK36DRAFT_1172035 [Trichoderma citrinoviride]
MLDLLRESPIGQALRLIETRFFNTQKEKQGFQPPEGYITQLKPRENFIQHYSTISSVHTAPFSNEQLHAERELELQRTRSIAISPQKASDGIPVDWYTTDDPTNPRKWSRAKREFVLFILCPIYAAAEEEIQQQFGVIPVASTLGLGLYVLAFGIGDLPFSPLSELPSIGRSQVYVLTYIVYWILSFPETVVDGFGGLLTLRFWVVFFSNPALANGGATVGDMFSLVYIPFGLFWWVFSAWAGPAIGLVILTGNSRLQSQSEIDQHHMSTSAVVFDAFVRPLELMMKDPSIFFVDPMYGINFGETGLTFLSCLVGVIDSLAAYFAYIQFYIIPDNINRGLREQEYGLVSAIIGSFLWPISMAVIFAMPLFIKLGVDKGSTLLAGLSVTDIFGTTAIYIFGKILRAK